MIIIKVDASCFNLTGHAGWAVSVRNGRGPFYESGHILTSSSLVAEKIANYMGLTAAPAGKKAVLESDCKCAIDHIKKPRSPIDYEIAALWRSKPNVRIKWVSRKKLADVDALSREAAKGQSH